MMIGRATRGWRGRRWYTPIAFVTFFFVIATLASFCVESANGSSDCSVDDSDYGRSGGDETCGAEKNDESGKHGISTTFRNLSPYRADVHFDDGRFGNLVSALDGEGGTTSINSFPGHRFFITRHGVREGLVDPETDEQYIFTVPDSEGRVEDALVEFILPANAAPSKAQCKDRYPVCRFEAERGECERNPGWMIVNCCGSCDDVAGYGHLADRNVRCSRERLNATIPAWTPGSLNGLFEKWATSEEYKQYDPHVVSSPGKIYGSEHDGPWIMTFDSFADDDEISALIEGGKDEGFERSTDQGQMNESGEREKVMSKSRTSSNAWCRSKCESLPGVKKLSDKIEKVTSIPQGNYESFQILKYNEGQFYRSHHDSSSSKGASIVGHRVLTFFLYLNDVEEGGETGFTNLGIDVKPKGGRALVWSSVLNEDPEESDLRMFHEAKAVVRGTKMAANHWIHQYDFVNSNKWGCSGSFS